MTVGSSPWNETLHSVRESEREREVRDRERRARFNRLRALRAPRVVQNIVQATSGRREKSEKDHAVFVRNVALLPFSRF